MSDAFRETSAQEAQMAVLQFMGQHLTGDLKELEKNILTPSLASTTLRPEDILRSVGAAGLPQHPQAQPQSIQVAPPVSQPVAPVIQQAVEVPVLQVQQPAPVQTPVDSQDQLEFNFNTSPYTERVFEKLEAISQAIRSLNETQQEILLAIKSAPVRTKKKD